MQTSCNGCLIQTIRLNRKTIHQIQEAYCSSNIPWYLGFSGGKDSSCVAALVYRALKELRTFHKPVTAVYIDTGVDIPIVAKRTALVLQAMRIQARDDGLPIRVSVARPPIADRFFVKVVGRGYATPTNKFRWCTDRLRINPVKRLLDKNTSSDYLVLLGTRRGESIERDRTLRRHKKKGRYYFRQSTNPRATIYSPILDYSTDDVWSTLTSIRGPKCIDAEKLRALYQSASGECPTVRDPKGTPCGKGRFGCWTCTVVRQDKAMQGLVASGFDELSPLLEFRNWLSVIRDDPRLRCKRRRNGNHGLGPFTLKARALILDRLLLTERMVPWNLISDAELRAIYKLWEEDSESEQYSER